MLYPTVAQSDFWLSFHSAGIPNLHTLTANYPSTTFPTSRVRIPAAYIAMKPVPFPFALNIGTDIVHLPRITALLTRRGNYLTRFTRRILCDQEQRDFHHRFKESLSLQSQSQNNSATPTRSSFVTADMTRWLAGRFAAKEAARKAAPDGAASIGWKDVMVRVQEESDSDLDTDVNTGVAQSHLVNGLSRKPEIVYLGSAEDGSDSRVGKLSISHDGEYVVATVLAAG